MTANEARASEVSSKKVAAMEDLDVQLILLWRRARSINHQLTRKVHPDLEPAAYGLLSVLLHEGSMRLTELAGRIGVGKPSVSRQITFLEDVGLLTRETDPSDGRAQLISLTEAGQERMRTVHTGRQEAFHERLASWEEPELESLVTLLAKLNAGYST